MTETSQRLQLDVELPVLAPTKPQIVPTSMTCLRCQLLGRRRLVCTKADACKELPLTFALGPILLVGWIVTAIAFFVAVK